MSRKPAISPDEKVTLARCPVCQGAAMSVISRFVTNDDRKELIRLERIGYESETLSLRASLEVESCECSPAVIAQHKAQIAAKKALQSLPPPPNRPVLSLKRNPR